MFKGNESVAMFMYNSSVAGTRAKSKTPNQRCAGRGIAVTTVINMLRSARQRCDFVYQIKPPSQNI